MIYSYVPLEAKLNQLIVLIAIGMELTGLDFGLNRFF